jgi:two-component system chemotaxis sensor kinase CheA
MDDLLQEFLAETAESLASLDTELVRLERQPDDAETLSAVFRLVHTIKGTCGFLGLPRLERLAHAGEDVLGGFRDGSVAVTPDAVSAVLACIDGIRTLVTFLEATGAEPAGSDDALIADLEACAAAGSGPGTEASGAAPAATVLADLDAVLVRTEAAVREFEAAAVSEPTVDTVNTPMASKTIRVAVDVLENLMTLVSELVLTRNQLLQMFRGRDDIALAEPMQRLNLVTSELQEGVMKARMQPIGNAWAKLPRIVRDLSVDTGKMISLRMLGGDTELDRQVLELIRDPLTHMVRNSADHGIEPPERRRQLGKHESGTIALKACHEGGHIIIEIADDGCGLDVDRIRCNAVDKGLVTTEEARRLSDHQLQQLIFRPGFSTAERVTSVSGRGVGLDVVRTNIAKIGGTIDLKSAAGEGTALTIKIPLTLAIVSVLIVGCGGQRFALPQIDVRELVDVSAGSRHALELINGTPVLRLRSALLPVVSLRALLGLGSESTEDSGSSFVVVSQVGSGRFGIVVDRVLDTEEIVVKPVARILRRISIYAGTTILGDGSVIMILDPNGIAAGIGPGALTESDAREPAIGSGDRRTPLVLFRAGGPAPKAVPMALVARLEEVDMATIEHVAGCRVVQYGGGLMPLVMLEPGDGWPAAGRRPVLVFADRGRTAGLVVDDIVDIVEDDPEIQVPSHRPGFLGVARIAGKATDLIDVAPILTNAFPDWADGTSAAGIDAAPSADVVRAFGRAPRGTGAAA